MQNAPKLTITSGQLWRIWVLQSQTSSCRPITDDFSYQPITGDASCQRLLKS